MKINRANVFKTLRNVKISSQLFSAFTLLCGVMTVTGVFLPWFHISKSVLGFTLSYSASGWEMAARNSLPLEVFTHLSGRTFPQPHFVFAAGLVLIAMSIFALVISVVDTKRLNIKLRAQGIAAALTALVSFGIAMWFLSYVLGFKDYLDYSDISVSSFGFGYGFFISTIFSFLAMIVGIVTAARTFRKTRQVNKNNGSFTPEPGRFI